MVLIVILVVIYCICCGGHGSCVCSAAGGGCGVCGAGGGGGGGDNFGIDTTNSSSNITTDIYFSLYTNLLLHNFELENKIILSLAQLYWINFEV